MYVDFKDLPETSRIWIYQSDKELEPKQIEDMRQVLKEFVDDWTRHGQDLKGSFDIFHNLAGEKDQSRLRKDSRTQ